MIFGFGLGYHVESYLQKTTEPVNVLILEPIVALKSIAEKIFERISKSYETKGHRVGIIFGLEEFLSKPLSSWLSQETNKVSPFLHPVYSRKFSDLTLNFLDSLKQNSQNDAAKDYFQKIWARNYVRNLTSIFENSNSSRILSGAKEHFFQDQTLLFTGASPSLEEETDWILKNRNRFHLLASDTSLGWILNFGIVPDAVLSLDSSRGTIFHFRNILPEDVPILTWFGGSTYLFDLPNPKWIYFSTYPLDQILRSLFFPKAPILENPSLNMAGIALSLAKQLEYDRLFLKGVDFRRSGGRTHCRSSGYEVYDRSFLSRKESLFKTRFQKSKSWERRFSVLEILKNQSPELFRLSNSPAMTITKKLGEGLIWEDPKKIQLEKWFRFCVAHPDLDRKSCFSPRILNIPSVIEP
ncbi:6-hydroxymethylpterin diphosphokinase MptE-like protein [Leptospira alstonii]|uniref:6-hydroxymethylpterin diphosphokinase MptE-like protein n=1 Tax=Leptospira alstonii TaxID=28452 RepID=UPI0007730BF0|nr:6-hydroxymethylpterin diphosphokinase MptE-like protein [Leptospira alstonii]